MAQEIYEFQVSTPAGTQQAAPQVTELPMPPRLVNQVEIRIPPGPRGELGFALGAAGMPVIPRAAGTFVVTDDERIVWPLEGQIDSGAWECFTYNTGAFPHTVYLRFLVSVMPAELGAPVFAPIPVTDLAPQNPPAAS